MAKKWSKEELEYLEENWGKTTVASISKKLNRSINAILVKKDRLKLGSFLESGDYISVNQLFIALTASTTNSYKLNNWIVKYNFPLKYQKVKNCNFKIVAITDFWKWAESNRNLIDFNKLPDLLLGKEPFWVKEQRTRDYKNSLQHKNTPWTELEDEVLKSMVNEYRFSYLDISKELRRSSGAILKRLNDLNIKARPIAVENKNGWSAEEENYFGRMISEGYGYGEMSIVLNKNDKALRSKLFNFYHTEQLDKVRKLINNGVWGTNAPSQTKQMQRRERERISKIA